MAQKSGSPRGYPLQCRRSPESARAAATAARLNQPPPRLASIPLFAAPVNRLITELSRLPGIGQRTAQRLAFHILSTSEEEALALADAIREVKATVGHCEVCFNLATDATCRVCQDERREAATICVVEQPSDVIPIERSGEFQGRYHVLGGALSPIDGVDPEDLHIAELLGRVDNGGVREVVIATNATTTGEATALYLADALRERAPDVVVTRLASGLPVGSDLEYADEITLGRALRGRQAI
jgi:recombination protein RecR